MKAPVFPLIVLLLLAHPILFTENLAAQVPPNGTIDSASSGLSSPPPAPIQAMDQVQPEGTSRWLELNNLSFSMRYRDQANSVGVHMFQFGQHREIIDGRFKFDSQGRYSINFHASSGRYFNWAYADTIGGTFADQTHFSPTLMPAPIQANIIRAIVTDPEGFTYAAGIQSRGAYIFMRQLYLSATPVDPVTVEFGSLPIERGVNTEITSFDEDGYMAGERIRLRDVKHLYFTEVDGTWGYLGDPFTPNFFRRGDRLEQFNYQQYLAKKEIGKRLVASADFTRLRGTDTFREAIKVQLPEVRWIDSARGEFYQRINDISFYGITAPSGSGFAASVTKNIKKKMSVDFGFASIDDYYSSYSGSPFLIAIGFAWNSDSLVNGNKGYARLNYKIAPAVSLFGFYTHTTSIKPLEYTIAKQGLNMGFNVDFAEMLHSRHLF